jgi:hypothetical protein
LALVAWGDNLVHNGSFEDPPGTLSIIRRTSL